MTVTSRAADGGRIEPAPRKARRFDYRPVPKWHKCYNCPGRNQNIAVCNCFVPFCMKDELMKVLK